ncbi:dual specificity protein phosphatase [Nitrososphaera sp.]|uniref:dual specificity protein phosphatase family protein n=1 Tax=Nitrososphaera sp. TaxID=1971748 RepID=UPI001791C1C9|nr:dual specificity protein phosphatase [Nitrososphaera sp.]NWG36113.1 dual specificity protein phosphatase family protein [Nitrososphaera sp.]
MFKVTDTLATHGLGETTYPAKGLQEGFLGETDFWIVDVRDMLDESQPVDVYRQKIDYAISCLEKHGRIVVCCGAGQSRSPAIAIGVLMKRYSMDFYDAYNLVRENVPVAQIEPSHIRRLKELFDVGLP